MADTAAAAAADAPPTEPIATLPSGETVDSSAPPPPPGPAEKKGPSMADVVAAAPAGADAFIAHLARCLQARGSTDTVLMFLTYGSRFVAASLEAASRPALRSSAQKLVDLAFKLPPKTTVVLSSTPAPPLATLALTLAARLKALGAVLGEWRTMNRLFGLVGMYFAFKKLLLAAKASSSSEKKTASPSSAGSTDAAVAFAQLTALSTFYATENMTYLASKKVLGFSPATQLKLAGVSVRAWALYVALDIGKLLVERGRRRRAARAAASSGVEAREEERAWAATWHKNFTRNLAWAPLTVQWSMANGPLPDVIVWALGLYPAAGEMLDLWRSTA